MNNVNRVMLYQENQSEGVISTKYLAHKSEDGMREQSLIDHLNNTAELASNFANQFGMAERAFRCGLVHDIGKYSEKFQRRINGSSEKVDHSSAGVILIGNEYRDIPSAFCIAGHHGGLPDGGNYKFDTPEAGTLAGKLKRKKKIDIESFDAYKNEVTLPNDLEKDVFAGVTDKISLFFGIRMLYSCLVDADYLDTESFMSDGKIERGGYRSLAEMKDILTSYMYKFPSSESLLNRKRFEIRHILLERSNEGKGLFSLTVPTGGGKTLASLSFAINHAISNGLSRVIYVIPYCSIIEQTQNVFSDIFGEENVVAHYSNVEYNTDESRTEIDTRYLSSENWDAPLIITTAVQFFESLYACRSSSCRKLHNIANSVIIFDEAQMLPVPYLRPCISAISLLVSGYGCSAVLCTATQPSLDRLFNEFCPGYAIRELYSGKPDDAVFQRVHYQYDGQLSDDELVCRISAQKQVLCIVNNRNQAQKLYEHLSPDGSFYLTTTMYPKHRRETLNTIRNKLKTDQPCRVISTSLIEAGVDVDFPTVYRAIAGLDSICQSGGRCNREGKRSSNESVVHIFDTENKAPSILQQNISVSKRIIDKYGNKMTSPEAIKEYFDILFYLLKGDTGLDFKNIMNRIRNEFFPFESVGKDFKLIESPTKTVYILFRDKAGQELAHELAQGKSGRNLWRKLGQYAVSVYPQQYDDLLESCALEVLTDNSAILADSKMYDEKTGISLAVERGNLIEF